MNGEGASIDTRVPQASTALWAVVVAAGRGRRMGSTIPKQYLPMHVANGGNTHGARARGSAAADPFEQPQILVLEQTLLAFLEHPALEGLVVVVPADDRDRLLKRLQQGPLAAYIAAWQQRAQLHVAAGGRERLDSVLAGLAAVAACRTPAEDIDHPRWVLVHDGARPCLARGDLDRLVQQAGRSDAGDGVVLAAPSVDTMKQVGPDGRIVATVPRETLWRAFTPQLFPLQRLRDALESARQHGQMVTDEASAIELAGGQPRVLQGSADNRKITVAEDLLHARAWLERASPSPASGRDEPRPRPDPEATMMTTDPMHMPQSRAEPRNAPRTGARVDPQIGPRIGPRIGQGFDVHAFGPGDGVVLGGVTIPFGRGLVAHSDGDVLLHALCDALLGAAALGDIGQHFPDDDDRFAGADSRVLLRQAVDLLTQRGWVIGNVDCTVIAQAPKLAPHVRSMAANIAQDCRIEPEQVGVKATTTERLGFTGRGEGIAAQAVAMLFPAAPGSA